MLNTIVFIFSFPEGEYKKKVYDERISETCQQDSTLSAPIQTSFSAATVDKEESEENEDEIPKSIRIRK